jgi:hypothetical protein
MRTIKYFFIRNYYLIFRRHRLYRLTLQNGSVTAGEVVVNYYSSAALYLGNGWFKRIRANRIETFGVGNNHIWYD